MSENISTALPNFKSLSSFNGVGLFIPPHPIYLITADDIPREIRALKDEKKFLSRSQKAFRKKSPLPNRINFQFLGLAEDFGVDVNFRDPNLQSFFKSLSEFRIPVEKIAEDKHFNKTFIRPNYPKYYYFNGDESSDLFQKLEPFFSYGSIILTKVKYDLMIRFVMEHRINNPIYDIFHLDNQDDSYQFTPSFWNGKRLPICIVQFQYPQMFAHPEIEIFHPDHFLDPAWYLEDDIYDDFFDVVQPILPRNPTESQRNASVAETFHHLMPPNPFFAPLVGEKSKFAFFMDPTPYLNQLRRNCTLGKLPEECFLTKLERKALVNDSLFTLDKKDNSSTLKQRTNIVNLDFLYTWFEVNGKRRYLYTYLPLSYRVAAEYANGILPAFSIPSYLLLIHSNTFLSDIQLASIHFIYFVQQMYQLTSSSRIAIAHSHASSLRYWLKKDKCFAFFNDYPITSIDNPVYQQMKKTEFYHQTGEKKTVQMWKLYQSNDDPNIDEELLPVKGTFQELVQYEQKDCDYLHSKLNCEERKYSPANLLPHIEVPFRNGQPYFQDCPDCFFLFKGKKLTEIDEKEIDRSIVYLTYIKPELRYIVRKEYEYDDPQVIVDRILYTDAQRKKDDWTVLNIKGKIVQQNATLEQVKKLIGKDIQVNNRVYFTEGEYTIIRSPLYGFLGYGEELNVL